MTTELAELEHPALHTELAELEQRALKKATSSLALTTAQLEKASFTLFSGASFLTSGRRGGVVNAQLAPAYQLDLDMLDAFVAQAFCPSFWRKVKLPLSLAGTL